MDKNKAMSGYERIFDDGYKAGRASVVLPHPCDGELYKDWTAADYFAKIAEEHLEVIDAYKKIEKSNKQPTKEQRDHFFKECTDLIVATTGLMNYFGCDEAKRQKYMKEINESNAKRDGGKRFKKHPLDEIQERLNKGKTFSASGAEAEQSKKERFKDGDKAKIIIPESEIRRAEKEGDATRVQEMIITSNSIGRVIYHDNCLDTYALEVAGRIVGVPAEWLKKVKE